MQHIAGRYKIGTLECSTLQVATKLEPWNAAHCRSLQNWNPGMQHIAGRYKIGTLECSTLQVATKLEPFAEQNHTKPTHVPIELEPAIELKP